MSPNRASLHMSLRTAADVITETRHPADETLRFQHAERLGCGLPGDAEFLDEGRDARRGLPGCQLSCGNPLAHGDSNPHICSRIVRFHHE